MFQGVEFIYFAANPTNTKFLTDEEFSVSKNSECFFSLSNFLKIKSARSLILFQISIAIFFSNSSLSQRSVTTMWWGTRTRLIAGIQSPRILLRVSWWWSWWFRWWRVILQERHINIDTDSVSPNPLESKFNMVTWLWPDMTWLKIIVSWW